MEPSAEEPWSVDYRALLDEIHGRTTEEIVAILSAELPPVWADAYRRMRSRSDEIVVFRHGSFEYVFDHDTVFEATGVVPPDPTEESRLVAAFGRSNPSKGRRDDYRLKGWVGPTEKAFGRTWDKGHFIAHSIGGAVDGLEANVFIQRRDLNRGWSAAGKKYRAMEEYCFAKPATFCFSRPVYVDGTARPSALEFGILTLTPDLWVERFDNG